MATSSETSSGALTISSLRGGQNDGDPPTSLANDQCVLAENVEFFSSNLGERRNGCAVLSLVGSTLATQSVIVHLSQWFPTNDVLVPEFIAVAATPTVSAVVAKRTAGVWSDITPVDALSTSIPDIYGITTQSLSGKLFISYRSAVDRMHVWDGTTLRRTGLAQPAAAPTAADTGVGTYSGIRYFRVRYIVKSGATILYRSEPSAVLAKTPSGTGTGLVITKPATISEGETHWELEASTDNANFYLIATTVVGTTTYTDSTLYATGYSSQGALSEDIGEYLNITSAKYIAVDGDRLIFAGHWTDAAKKSQVGWTPVSTDPGSGNNERLPLSVNNTINLDNYDGGPVTGIGASGNGTWYMFKWSAIYKMTRTGDVNKAYDAITISKTRGAIPGSIVRGMDEHGAPSVYFLDPRAGPSRIGNGGLQTIRGLRTTWARVNLQAAAVVACGVYYPYKQQIHWWVSVDGADRPSLKLVIQISEMRAQEDGEVVRGWSTATGKIATAVCAAIFTEVVSIDGITSLSERPFIGLVTPDHVQRCDVESTDNGTAYVATIRTRPFLAAGLLNKWGAMTATLLATANATASLKVKLIRDMGLETNQITTGLAATGSETQVIKRFDDLRMSEATTIQVEFSDS